MKYDNSGKEPILLVPQPSDDPNDPLNLPRWQRDIIVFILSLFSVLATTLSPLLAANSLVIAVEMRITISQAALLTGWHLLAVGIVGLVCVPLASKYGKRHLYLIGALLTIISCAAAGQTPYDAPGSHYGYKYLIAWRVVQGAGLAPFEGLVNASVGDLFFVHERGKRMALSNLAIFGGAFFTPVICGVITDEIGWRWAFNLVAILTGAMFPLLFFFVPETAFRRHEVADASGFENTMTASVANRTSEHSPDSTPNNSYYETKEADVTTTGLSSTPVPTKKPYWRTLLPFNGAKTDASLLKLFLRPFPLFLQPGIIWAMLIQGTIIGWTVLIGIVLAAVFYSPPLWFTPRETGYSYAAAFIGALVGFAISGLLSDSTARWMTRANRGVFEPEFRMLLVIPCFVLGCAGLYGFGYTSNDLEKYNWIGPVVFFGFEVAGMVCGAVASALYIADAHRKFPLSPAANQCKKLTAPSRRRSRSVHVRARLQERLLLRPDGARL